MAKRARRPVKDKGKKQLGSPRRNQVSIRLSETVKAQFLENLTQYPSVLDACNRAKAPRNVLYNLRRRDPEFAAAWDEARLIGNDVLERVAVMRATEGEDEPIVFGGKISTDKTTGKVITVKRKSDILLMFLMKSANPARYRESSTVELTGKNGGPVEVRSWADVMEAVAAPVIDQEGRRV